MSKPVDAHTDYHRPAPLRIAVHGVLADRVGSGAGTFPVLLAGLLERGHRVDQFGPHGYGQKSLEHFENYRFVSLRLPKLEWLWWKTVAWKAVYSQSAVSQMAQIGWQREAVLNIQREADRYDLIFCTDAVALWPSKLPIVSWPQSPPHTEARALRSNETARRTIQALGKGKYAAIQIFYAYRWLAVRAALGVSDVYLCGSNWARDEWQRFGAKPEQLVNMSYLIDLEPFSAVPPLDSSRRPITFLWLGRATPSKRLDLFLEGFRVLRRRNPEVLARVVGNLRGDPFAERSIEPYRSDAGISFEAPVSREMVPRLFGEVDVLVQPSEMENFGFSVAEALAAGRPVVLGPTNGTADYVGDAGFVFSEYGPESVARAMERAMSAVASDGPELSARARTAARRHFTPSRVVDRFEVVCQELLARGTKRS